MECGLENCVKGNKSGDPGSDSREASPLFSGRHGIGSNVGGPGGPGGGRPGRKPPSVSLGLDHACQVQPRDQE